jgi:hypothetical protein
MRIRSLNFVNFSWKKDRNSVIHGTYLDLLYSLIGTVVVVIAWLLDLQLPMQSVIIITNVVSLNPAHARCTYTTLCDKVCQ